MPKKQLTLPKALFSTLAIIVFVLLIVPILWYFIQINFTRNMGVDDLSFEENTIIERE